jgi:hypothetical protein
MDGATALVTMEGPLACVIWVDGALDPHWTGRLGGLGVAVSGTAAAPVAELRGELPDQAALLAVLRTLHALGLPLRAVSCTPAAGCGGLDARLVAAPSL